MPEHDLAFLQTQWQECGGPPRAPEGTRRKAVTKAGVFIRIEDGRMVVGVGRRRVPDCSRPRCQPTCIRDSRSGRLVSVVAMDEPAAPAAA
jgi:hypothetical protein